MKKAAVFFVFLLLVVGVLYFRNSRAEETAPGDKYIGAVSVTLYEEETAIPGRIISRCYLEKQELYDQPKMVVFTDTMPRFTQLAADFTTATTQTTTTTQTETTEQKKESAATAKPEEGAVSDLEVKYVGELYGVPTYTIYDEKYKVLVEPQERLELPTEPGLYYVESEVKWGKKKNYTMMKYYFVMEVIE